MPYLNLISLTRLPAKQIPSLWETCLLPLSAISFSFGKEERSYGLSRRRFACGRPVRGPRIDRISVTWNLKRGVTWYDGRPFTTADVVFTWQYAADPAVAAVSLGVLQELDRVEKLHDHDVEFVFKKPTPFWPEPALASVIPRHVFEPYRGARSRAAPANLKPVGTGAYRCVDSKPGDTLRAELNPGYNHVANQPFFDTVDLKGGGDAVSAARAVLQTGEYDYAWNLQVDDDLLPRLEQSGRSRRRSSPRPQLRTHLSDRRRRLRARGRSTPPCPSPSARRWPACRRAPPPGPS